MEVFSKGGSGKNLNHKTLSEREATYFSQYNGLKDIDDYDTNKREISNILFEDYKNMTSEEKSHVPESLSKFFENLIKSNIVYVFTEDIPSSFRSSFSTATGAKIDRQVKINGQHFDKVECGGGGDCCFRSIAEAIGIGSDNYMKVREELANKEIEMANSKGPLPETLKMALVGVYKGLNMNNDEECKKALKYHAQNVTSRDGKCGELVDLHFVPRLHGLAEKKVRVFAFDKDSRRTYAGNNRCNGLDEKIKPQKGDVVLFNTGGHWQMLKLIEQKPAQ